MFICTDEEPTALDTTTENCSMKNITIPGRRCSTTTEWSRRRKGSAKRRWESASKWTLTRNVSAPRLQLIRCRMDHVGTGDDSAPGGRIDQHDESTRTLTIKPQHNNLLASPCYINSNVVLMLDGLLKEDGDGTWLSIEHQKLQTNTVLQQFRERHW